MNKFAFVMSLTCGRAPLVLLGCACSLVNFVAPAPAWVVAAVVLLAFSALTDMFDGALARKWQVTSRIGALADPLMDKVFYLATLPTATFMALLLASAYEFTPEHPWILLLLDIVSLLRDQWVSFLRSVGSEFHADVRATWSGKLRTIIGFPVIVFLHLYLGLEWLILNETIVCRHIPCAVPYVLEGLYLAITVVSCVSYTLRYMPYLKQASKHDHA